MRKSSSFSFHASNFLSETQKMTDLEVGQYIQMLSFQFISGGIPNNPSMIKQILGLNRIPGKNVLSKFQLCEDGMLRNMKFESV